MNERIERILGAFAETYGGLPDVWVRAPGRVDLMGSHTDYNLGYVLTLPISRDTVIAARASRESMVRVRSLAMDAEDGFSLDAIQRAPAGHWSNYVRGVASVLQREGFPLTGLEGVIDTTVPLGSGLSSSAALECAAAVLFRSLGGWPLDSLRMAQLCQRAENEFAGVSCGILDQFTSCAGRAGCALLLDCRDLSGRPVPLPDDISTVICDTRARRELSGSEYGKRRADCEHGARLMGVPALRDSNLEQLNSLGDRLSAQAARRCRFILEENERVLRLAAALPRGDRREIGALCAESFRGAAELYEIVIAPMKAMVEAMLAAPGVIGARQAGAGFGGCVVGLVDSGSVTAFSQAVRSEYRKATGVEPLVYPVEAADGAELLKMSSMEVTQ